MNHKNLAWKLDALANTAAIDTAYRDAVKQAALMLSELNSALSFLGGDDLYAVRHAYIYAGLGKEWAIQALEEFDPEVTVAEMYASCDSLFDLIISMLIGPDFEYPDWSHKTVGEVLEKFK